MTLFNYHTWLQPYCKQEVALLPVLCTLVTDICVSSSNVISWLALKLFNQTTYSQWQRWQQFGTLNIVLSKFYACGVWTRGNFHRNGSLLCIIIDVWSLASLLIWVYIQRQKGQGLLIRWPLSKDKEDDNFEWVYEIVCWKAGVISSAQNFLINVQRVMKI